MKKRTIALVALVFAVVVTAFSVSGTYARYATKQTGTDTARVAKWKVGEELTVNMFSESYLANDASSEENAVQSAGAGEESINKVVAPGTRGSYAFTIDTASIDVETNYKLIPEVALKQTTKSADYQPIKFYLFESENFTAETDLKTAEAFAAKKGSAIQSTESGVDAAGLQTAIQAEFADKVFNSSKKPSKSYVIVWEWALGNDVTSSAQLSDETNTKDTTLGKSSAASTGGVENEKFEFTVNVLVVQSENKVTE